MVHKLSGRMCPWMLFVKRQVASQGFCVYDEPSADLCLHKNLYLANVHHLAVKRDGVQSIQIE